MAWQDPATNLDFTTGEQVTAAKMDKIKDNFVVYGNPALDTWTPALSATVTAPVLSDDESHTATGHYIQIGSLVVAWAQIAFGTSGVSAGSGQYTIDLPVTASGSIPLGASIGGGRVYDNSGADTWFVDARHQAGVVRLRFDEQTGPGNVTEAAPFGWANSDSVSVFLVYPAA